MGEEEPTPQLVNEVLHQLNYLKDPSTTELEDLPLCSLENLTSFILILERLLKGISGGPSSLPSPNPIYCRSLVQRYQHLVFHRINTRVSSKEPRQQSKSKPRKRSATR